MSDHDPAASSAPKSAGTMLREARQARGLHIGALAASIKISPRKLEFLEADQLSELPDATFARALAQTMCRSLKIDPAPVLAALPQAPGYRLEAVDEGIKLPFRDRPGRHEPASSSWLMSPAVWASVLIALAAVFVYLMPSDWIDSAQGFIQGADAPQPAAAASGVALAEPSAWPASAAVTSVDGSASAVTEAGAAGTVVETVHSAPDAPSVVETAPSGAAVGPLQLKASEQSWVEVVDARSQILFSRMLLPGETVVLDGTLPLRIKVGNAVATQLTYRGVAVDLAASTRDNVARLELK